MAFVPPVYGDFGKSAKDLLTKKYSFERSVTLKSTTANGVKFETSGEATKDGFLGAFKAKYADKEYGTFEERLSTSGSLTYSWETSRLRPGLTLKVSGDEEPKLATEVTYKQESVTFGAVATSNGKATTLKSSASVGFDGASAGGEVAYNVATQSVSDYNVGAQYSQPDFTVTVKSANQANDIGVSYIHDISRKFAVGGQFLYSLLSGNRSFTAGASYAVDDAVLVKAKANNAGVVTALVQHTLVNPQVTFRITSEYDATAFSVAPEKVGVAVVLGEDN